MSGQGWSAARDHPVLLLFWYAAETVFVVATHETVIRGGQDFIDPGLRICYSIFSFLCVLLFFVAVGPLLFIAEFRYRPVAAKQQRSLALHSAVALWFLLCDSPLLMMNILLYVGEGTTEVPQGVLQILSGASWFCGACVVWFRVMRVGASRLHNKTRASAENGGMTCDQEILEQLAGAALFAGVGIDPDVR
eukprot:TRINITY_DN36534_c0_g1_i1.p1 TRINITY_DN36534_c0_g1~~TRINITY_DN36534_c0_g1_i1.p1  ORF type:complete len:192 (+),score=51.88 TRINITY_DN36534_c0_g1_i1:55-630(+)